MDNIAGGFSTIFLLALALFLWFLKGTDNPKWFKEKSKNGKAGASDENQVHGSARLMEKKEMQNELPYYIQEKEDISYKDKEFSGGNEGPGGIVVESEYIKDGFKTSKDKVKVTYNNKPVHHVIIGSTGSGKTTGLIGNSIDSISNAKASMVIGDPKGELYTRYHEYLREKGYKIQVLNFEHPDCGQNFNQMEYICKQYELGMPYCYREKAINEMIKFINFIKTKNNDERPKLKFYQTKMVKEKDAFGNVKEKPKFDLFDFEIGEDFKPNTDGKLNVDNGEILVKYLREVFTHSYTMANQAFQIDTSSLVDPKDNQGNIYLHFKEEQTIQQGIELLKTLNLATIKKYFEDRIAYYREYMKTTDESNINFIKAKNKIDYFEETIETMQQDEGFDADILLRYLNEMKNECEEIFKEYEQEAVTNASTIAEMIIESKQVGSQRGESIWIDTPKALLTSLILFVARESHVEYSKHLGSTYRMMSDLSYPVDPSSRDATTILDTIFNAFKNDDAIKLSQTATRVAGDRTKTSINVSLIAPLQVFADSIVVGQSSRTSFDVTEVAETPTAIFLNIPGSDTSQTYTILASLFIEQMYTELIKKAKSYPSNSLPRPCYFLIDEFGNIPKIPNFDSKVSLARSYNIRFNVVIQDFGQLDKKYKDERTTIMGNSNIVYLLTNDNTTAKWVSERLGSYTAKIENVNKSTNDKGVTTSESTTYMKADLYTPQDLMDSHFMEGTSVYIQPRHDPYEAHTVPNYRMPNFSHISSSIKDDLNNKRPKEVVNYFSPEDYQLYICAYKSFWEDCILDGYFAKLIQLRKNNAKTIKANESLPTT